MILATWHTWFEKVSTKFRDPARVVAKCLGSMRDFAIQGSAVQLAAIECFKLRQDLSIAFHQLCKLEKDGLAFTGRLAAPALVSERFMGSFDRGVGIVVRCNAIATDHLPSRGIDAIGFLPVGTQAPFAANQEFRRLIEEASRRIGNLVHTRISFP